MLQAGYPILFTWRICSSLGLKTSRAGVTPPSPRIVTECSFTRSMLIKMYIHDIYSLFRLFRLLVCLFVCVEVLRPCQQLKSNRAGQLPINTVPGQALSL